MSPLGELKGYEEVGRKNELLRSAGSYEVSQRNGREKGDMWEPFCFYYRPSYVVTFVSASEQDKLKPQAEGSTGCFTRYITRFLLASRVIFYTIRNHTKLSNRKYILVLSYLSFDYCPQGVVESQ